MKKLLLVLIILTSTFIIEASVKKLDYEDGIQTYCIHSYIFVRYNASGSPLVQVMTWDNSKSALRPMKCSEY